MHVKLYGMAGTPTASECSKIDGVKSVRIERADKGYLDFELVEDEIRTLGGNEYQVAYDSK